MLGISIRALVLAITAKVGPKRPLIAALVYGAIVFGLNSSLPTEVLSHSLNAQIAGLTAAAALICFFLLKGLEDSMMLWLIVYVGTIVGVIAAEIYGGAYLFHLANS